MNFLRRLLRRTTIGKRRSPQERAETEAQESARKYWEREVAEEKVRRGTADPPRE